MADDVQDDQSTDTFDSWVQGLGVSANSFGSPDTSQADDSSGDSGGSVQTDTDTSDTSETGDSGGGGSVSSQDDSGGDSGQDDSGGDSGQSDLGGDSDSDDPIPLGQSAQAGDIETALRKAGLWDLQNDVSKLLAQAKVPDNVNVKINIVVDSNLNVSYSVSTSPNHASGATLARLLSGKYSGAMKNAIKGAGLSVTGSVTVGWLTF